MKTGSILAVSLTCFAFFAGLPAQAEEKERPAEDIAVRFVAQSDAYHVADNGALEVVSHAELKVLKQEAVDAIKERNISYSTSIEKVDIETAYTLKADGRRIDVPKDNYQLQVNSGKDGNAPSYSDQTTLTIIFPDLAVGDTAVLTYKQVDLEPIFPNHFSFMQNYSKYYAYDDVKISIDMPVALGAKYEAYGLKEVSNTIEDGRQKVAWSYANPHPPKYEGGTTSPYKVEQDNALLVSTFSDYAAIAQAYGERALPKAAVTPEIQKLADEITQDKATPHEQAKAIYDWVVKSITYAGNCIGVGAVVPRDLAFVIGNKMGDCKDHATLLQALLAAKGIQSTQALIGVNSIYQMPKTPVVSSINHVMNYIPALDVFVDATAKLPFGILSPGLYSKPILLVDGYKEGQTTPPMTRDLRTSKVDTKVAIAADGTATGTVDINLKGYAAYAANKSMSELTEAKRADAFKNMLRSYGYEGQLDLGSVSYDEAALTLNYQFKFTINKFIAVGNPGALYVSPLFAEQAIARVISGAMQSKGLPVSPEFLCSGMYAEEVYSYTFPPNVSILAMPDNVLVATPSQSYTAEYVRDGATVKVLRRLDDTTPGPVCVAAINADYEKVAEKAWPDMKAQIVYK